MQYPEIEGCFSKIHSFHFLAKVSLAHYRPTHAYSEY